MSFTAYRFFHCDTYFTQISFAGIKNNSYICIIEMPEVLKRYGFVFFFYSKEHEPIHIHVEGEGGLVVYDLIEGEFILRKQIGKIKASSVRKIERTLAEEKQLIIDSWNKHFGYYENEL